MTDDVRMEPIANRVQGRGVWEHFTVLDGLPDMKVECLTEDRDGKIWMGTHDGGAARYDGEHFECFSTEHGLSSDSIYSITEGLDGTLWFASRHGLTRYDGKSFEIIDGSQEYSFLWGACVDDSGVLWFGLDRRPGKPAGVIRCDEGKLELIEAEGEGPARGDSIKSVVAGDSEVYICADNLYLSTGFSLEELPWPEGKSSHHYYNHFVRQGDGFVVLTIDGAFQWRSGIVSRLANCESPGLSASVSSTSDLYLGSYSGRVLRLTCEGEESVELHVGRSIQALLFDSGGHLWVGTYGAGLARTEPDRWRLYDTPSMEVSPTSLTEGLSGRTVWVGSSEGLGSATRTSWMPVESELKHAVTAVLSDEEGGAWIGLRNGTIHHVSTDGVHKARYACPEVEGFSVVAIARGQHADEIWYACSTGLGLRRIRAGYVESAESIVVGIPYNIGALCYTEEHGLLIGTNDGSGSEKVYALAGDSLRQLVDVRHPVTALALFEGKLFVGTTKGLLTYWAEGDGFESQDLSTHSIKCLCADGHTRLWIGTEGAGLYLSNGQESTSVPLQLAGSWQVIDAICTDHDGRVWIATPAGLAVYTAKMDRAPDSLGLHDVANNPVLMFEVGQPAAITFTMHGTGWFSAGACLRWRILDTRWTWQISRSRHVELPCLPEGTYTVEAHIRDRDLNWGPSLQCQLEVSARRVDLMVEEALRAPVGIGYQDDGPTDGLRRLISQAAPSDLPVLIQGETGTGKSLAGRLLHDMSSRASGPFVSLNCAAIADSLAESELFGHVRGAFTGAVRDRVGKFELASGGTLLLDEIGDLSPTIQAKLLHVLQDGTVEPVGGGKPISVDVRVLAATNRDIRAGVADGSFREDLYFRLNAFEIEVSPLRHRPEDIEVLARLFMHEAVSSQSHEPVKLTKEAVDLLFEYNWPGNVRELKHVVERAVLLSEGGLITERDLNLRDVVTDRRRFGAAVPPVDSIAIKTWDQHERDYLERVLLKTKGVIAGKHGAAVLLGLKPSTLRSRLKRLGLL